MKIVINITVLLVSSFLLQGCGSKTFNIKNSDLPSEPFVATDAIQNHKTIAFIDKQPAGKKPFSHGKLKVNLELGGQAVNSVQFLENNVIAALNDKGIEVASDSTGDSSLHVEQFYVRNHRTNSYTPFVTFTTFKGTLEHNGQTHKIESFIKRGKVPVWSFNEVLEPTLNEPLALASKEVAAKINQVMFGRKISDEQVNSLIAHIKSNPKDKKSFLSVYELGFGNNKTAIENLVAFSQYDEEYIRLAALSSLGILKAESQIDYLWSVFETAKVWQDRAMALKALGDIGTQASKEKLQQAKASISTEKKKAVMWFTEILNLYL